VCSSDLHSPPYQILCELCKERAEALKKPAPTFDPLTAEPEAPA
jgi:hypothetical protein